MFKKSIKWKWMHLHLLYSANLAMPYLKLFNKIINDYLFSSACGLLYLKYEYSYTRTRMLIILLYCGLFILYRNIRKIVIHTSILIVRSVLNLLRVHR